jgi:hypothetical protein
MNTRTDVVGADGPLVKVAINFTTSTLFAFRQSGRSVPPAIEVLALIDTGADVSVFDPAALAPLRGLGLAVSRWLVVNAPGLGPVSALPEYAVSLSLPVGAANPLVFKSLPVVERALGTTGYQALLGRDVLAECGLWYDGPGGRFTLAF